MLIGYIGHKPSKQDNVAGTGLVWDGYGSVHEVSDVAACKRLLSYPGVWATAGSAEMVKHGDSGSLLVTQTDRTPPEDSFPPDLSEVERLEQSNDKAGLLAVARGLGIDIDGRSSAPKIISAIEAFHAAEAEKKGG